MEVLWNCGFRLLAFFLHIRIDNVFHSGYSTSYSWNPLVKLLILICVLINSSELAFYFIFLPAGHE